MLLVFFDGSLFLKWIEEGGLMQLVLPTMNLGKNDPLPDWLVHCVEDSAERVRAALAVVKSNICSAFQVGC